jgi:hypothetical protein
MSTITADGKARLLNGKLFDITSVRRWGIRIRVEHSHSTRPGSVKLRFLLVDETANVEFMDVGEDDVRPGDTVTIMDLEKAFTVKAGDLFSAPRSFDSFAEDVDPR